MGASWMTTAVGLAIAILTWINQIFVEQDVPKDGRAWIVFISGNLVGLLGVLAKQFNVSNAKEPAAPTAVSAENMAKPNPAASTGPPSPPATS